MLSSFSGCHSNLRLVIATSAFGLGIDCDDIQSIIHWGLPSTTEEYMYKRQEGPAVTEVML